MVFSIITLFLQLGIIDEDTNPKRFDIETLGSIFCVWDFFFSGSLLRRQEDYRLMELVAFLRYFVYFGTYWCVQLTETSSAYDDAIAHFKVSEQSVLAETHS